MSRELVGQSGKIAGATAAEVTSSRLMPFPSGFLSHGRPCVGQVEKRCDVCGAPFRTATRRKKRCSDDCVRRGKAKVQHRYYELVTKGAMTR